jgi:1,4-dihydroxy-6-naphthoate synthase
VVARREPRATSCLEADDVAIPGELTTAHLALKLWQPAVRTIVVPFDRSSSPWPPAKPTPAWSSTRASSPTATRAGAVVDLGAWWQGETGGPLPLGGNGIRRDLDPRISSAASAGC